MALLAYVQTGDWILGAIVLVAMVLAVCHAVYRSVRRHHAPIYMYAVVYPNGLRKEVFARDAEEAVMVVADDGSLRHDVVLYLDNRVVGVVFHRNGINLTRALDYL